MSLRNIIFRTFELFAHAFEGGNFSTYRRSIHIINLFSCIFSGLMICYVNVVVADDHLPTLPGIIEGTGTVFEITDSDYLNVRVSSTNEVKLYINSIPTIIHMTIAASDKSVSTEITIDGMEPNTTYWVYQNLDTKPINFTTSATGSYSFSVDLTESKDYTIQPGRSTVIIFDDGESGTGGDCTMVGIWDAQTKTCTLTQDIGSPINMESLFITDPNYTGQGVTLDGNDHYVYLPSWGSVKVSGNNHTIKNLNINGYISGGYYPTGHGIYLTNADSISVVNVDISNTYYGLYTYQLSNSIFSDSNINGLGVTIYPTLYGTGIYLRNVDNTKIYNVSVSNVETGLNASAVKNSDISDNTFSGVVDGVIISGYYVGVSGTIFSGNNFIATLETENVHGIWIQSGSRENIFRRNTYRDFRYGFTIYDFSCSTSTDDESCPYDNVVYQNNFINIQDYPIHATYGYSNTIYSLPEPIGGNYYSNYDERKEGCLDKDNNGFCDKPFHIYTYDDSVEIYDYLPWANQDGWPEYPVEYEVPVDEYLTTWISKDSDGNEGDGSTNTWPSISADGRFVVYYSNSTNLVSDDENDAWDVFIHDRESGVTKRVSVDSEGREGNRGGYDGKISADGRYVAFASYSSNLIPQDTNTYTDIFIKDLLTDKTSIISLNSDGSQANEYSKQPSISADGRFVAFASKATNLVLNDTNGFGDVFVHDRYTAETTRVSINANGNEANNECDYPVISADGRFVVFNSYADNLVQDDNNGVRDVFVHDRTTHKTTRINVDSDGNEGNYPAYDSYQSISADGRYVAFSSLATNLVSIDNYFNYEIFLHDRKTGETTRISVDPYGNEASGLSMRPSISADGRKIAFDSGASTLVHNDTNERWDCFVYDKELGETIRVSVDSEGNEGNDSSLVPSISADGYHISFVSLADNLVPETSSIDDYEVYVHGPSLSGLEISIDIEPTTEINQVWPEIGLLPVAILTDNDFDTMDVDLISVRFGPENAEPIRSLSEDVDNDDDLDLLFYFKTKETGIECGDTEATLIGATFSGISYTGTDDIVTMGCDELEDDD